MSSGDTTRARREQTQSTIAPNTFGIFAYNDTHGHLLLFAHVPRRLHYKRRRYNPPHYKQLRYKPAALSTITTFRHGSERPRRYSGYSGVLGVLGETWDTQGTRGSSGVLGVLGILGVLRVQNLGYSGCSGEIGVLGGTRGTRDNLGTRGALGTRRIRPEQFALNTAQSLLDGPCRVLTSTRPVL